MPLAIELAAARVGVLTPVQMLPRLEQRFELLARRQRAGEARHQSLRATIDWSFRLLPRDLQDLFAALSVFRGGFTLEAAEATCLDCGLGEGGMALDSLEQLRECSLILAEETPSPGQSAIPEVRFRLLETLREYGEERLSPADRPVLGQRHARYYLDLLERARAELTGPAQGDWLERLEMEHDNLRAALEGAIERDEAEAALRLGSALERFWMTRGYLTEGRERLARVLAGTTSLRTGPRARVLQGAGILAGMQGDYETARGLFEESASIWRELDNREGIGNCLNNLGMVAWHQGDMATARSLFEESLAIRRELEKHHEVAGCLANLGLVAWHQKDYVAARALFEESAESFGALGDRRSQSLALNNVGNVALIQGDLETARALCEESLALAREMGDPRIIAMALYNLAGVAKRREAHAEARSLYQESLLIRQEMGDKEGVITCLEGLAEVANVEKELPRAAWLLGAASTQREAIGIPVPEAAGDGYDADLAAIRAALGDAAFTDAWNEGRALSLDEAAARALEGA